MTINRARSISIFPKYIPIGSAAVSLFINHAQSISVPFNKRAQAIDIECWITPVRRLLEIQVYILIYSTQWISNKIHWVNFMANWIAPGAILKIYIASIIVYEIFQGFSLSFYCISGMRQKPITGQRICSQIITLGVIDLRIRAVLVCGQIYPACVTGAASIMKILAQGKICSLWNNAQAVVPMIFFILVRT